MDAGTKEMSTEQGRWSVQYNPEYVKAKGGKKKKPSATATSSGELSGREVRAEEGDLMKFVENYSLYPGWHPVSGVGNLVATDANNRNDAV